MAYIYVDHPVGSVRYVYDSEADAVHRVKVTKVAAVNTDENSNEFSLSYTARGRAGINFVVDSENLHSTARDAFPAEQAAVNDAAA